jgi:hypothetical protein
MVLFFGLAFVIKFHLELSHGFICVFFVCNHGILDVGIIKAVIGGGGCQLGGITFRSCLSYFCDLGDCWLHSQRGWGGVISLVFFVLGKGVCRFLGFLLIIVSDCLDELLFN